MPPRPPSDSSSGLISSGRDAGLLRLLAHVDLEENVDRPSEGPRAPVQLPRQLEAVERVDPVEEPRRVLGLVRLERADQMPWHRATERLDLLPGLLHAVLPERRHAGGHGGRMRSTSTVLETAMSRTSAGRAAGARARSGDGRVHSFQVGADLLLTHARCPILTRRFGTGSTSARRCARQPVREGGERHEPPSPRPRR